MAEKRTRLSDMTKAGRKAEKPTVIGAIRDPQFVRDVLQGLGETATRGITGVLGAPVDITTMAMRPFGYSVPAEQVVGGSEYLGKQLERAGMLSGNRNQLSELLAGLVTPDPVDAAKLGAMFIGPLAKTWDAEAAAKAARMELEGADPRAIWAETGTWKGPEGKWRQEISDADASLQDIPSMIATRRQGIKNQIDEIVKSIKPGQKPTAEQIEKVKALNAQRFVGDYKGNVGSVLEHPELFRSNPEMKDMLFDYFEMPSGARGYYSPEEGVSVSSKIAPNEAKSTLLHELQHAIQEREGFARGGSPEAMASQMPSEEAIHDAKILRARMDRGESIGEARLWFLNMIGRDSVPEASVIAQEVGSAREIHRMPATAEEAYRRLAGEAEARATQARMGMTAAERRAKFPEESYDVPLSELIIRDQPIGRSMSTRQAPRDEAMRIAQANAAKPISEGGLGLPANNTAMDRAKAMGFDTPAFHATGADFEAFNPSAYRQASFFAGTPEGAMRGRAAGQGDLTAVGKSENIMPVMLRSEGIEGLSFTPKERQVLSDYQGTLTEQQVSDAMKKMGGSNWNAYFDEIELPSGEFVYQAKSGSKPYQDVRRTGRDVYGSSLPDYDTASAERFAADYAKNRGMKGFMQRDEGGLSLGITDPTQIRSRFAAFDPARRYESDLLGAADPRLLGVIGLGTAGAIYKTNREKEKDRKREK